MVRRPPRVTRTSPRCPYTTLFRSYDPADGWNHLRRPVQQHILEKRLRLFVIDASGVAQLLGLGPRVNTILQACFFAISGILPGEEGIRRIRKAIEESYADKGRAILEKNFAAVDSALDQDRKSTRLNSSH